MAEDGGDPPVVAAANYNIKLPPFWPADPEIWFAQVEAHFTTKKLNAQKPRFDYVVASLSPEIATEVRDLILKPPEDNPYTRLKEQLIKRTAVSEQRRLQQLLHDEQLGDRKPTQLLRRMQQLLGPGDRAGIDGTFLKELFLQRLPGNVRMVLASSNAATSLAELAELADKVAEVAAPPIASVEQPQLSKEIEQLRAQVAKLQTNIKSLANSRSRSRTPRRADSPAPATTTAEGDLCWYHRKFGEQARKCNSPCALSPNSQASH